MRAAVSALISARMCARTAAPVTASAQPVGEEAGVSRYLLDRYGELGGFADRQLFVGSDSVAERIHHGGNQAQRLDELGVGDSCRRFRRTPAATLTQATP